MSEWFDREIINSSIAIDKALATISKTNRGEVAVRILSVVRNLNDNFAYKLWCDLYPTQPATINKVAGRFMSANKQYKFIAKFNTFLQNSVSHFTPSEEGAERLLIKYYRYILKLKKLAYDKYGIEIVNNISLFLEDLDEQTKDYYTKVANQIEIIEQLPKSSNFDNYYIYRIKPFYINRDIFFEVTLEPAEEKPNKFNRITAFTRCDITSNYCVALSFSDTYINVFNVNFPIKIITDWNVSIRPCEINNFARIFNIKSSIQRNSSEYRGLMFLLKNEYESLVDIIDLPDVEYKTVKEKIIASTKNNKSTIFDVLDKCRKISKNNYAGKNILRYILHSMNNRFIRDQRPNDPEKTFAGLYLSPKCKPFDDNPFSFNPKGHYSNLYDLLECINSEGHENELIARVVENSANKHCKLFVPLEELSRFGNPDFIMKCALEYNNGLYDGFRPNAEIGVYKNFAYNKGYELKTIEIIKNLTRLSSESSELSVNFSKDCVDDLKNLQYPEKLDDTEKEKILTDMFSQSRVQLIYGAAGTGKTTLLNHISTLLTNSRKAFLAKTNPAVENLRRKITSKSTSDDFVTIDSFTRRSYYSGIDYDLIVVDECSTVKNEEILKIISMLGTGVLVMVGDIYQIEAIGFGNWFAICKNILPKSCIHELTTPHRSSDENLKKLWGEVRNMTDDNVVLEYTVRNDYSKPIGEDIFHKESDDEIILCLNYNGLYGLNNINRLLQLSNPNKAINIGIWQFKIGDPVLFNDSERFSILYNNLKGKIIDIQDFFDSVYFILEVELHLTDDDVYFCDGLDLIEENDTWSKIGFKVSRREPYSSDEESTTKDHILPFQVAYAVSIHKSQGLEYDSVKIVIADETEDKITHNIFYTAITRTKNHLNIYWSPEVCNRILAKIRPLDNNKDYFLLKEKNNL